MAAPKIEITMIDGELDISLDNLSRSLAMAILQSALDRLMENELAQLKFETQT